MRSALDHQRLCSSSLRCSLTLVQVISRQQNGGSTPEAGGLPACLGCSLLCLGGVAWPHAGPLGRHDAPRCQDRRRNRQCSSTQGARTAGAAPFARRRRAQPTAHLGSHAGWLACPASPPHHCYPPSSGRLSRSAGPGGSGWWFRLLAVGCGPGKPYGSPTCHCCRPIVHRFICSWAQMA